MSGKKIDEVNLEKMIELQEMGIGELGDEVEESYDAVMSCLCFSELNDDELMYTLREAMRILKPGGLLIVADEVKPEGIVKRIVNSMIRIPLAIITYAITQTTTKAVSNLKIKIEKVGFEIRSVKLNSMENFLEIVAEKPEVMN